jgi:hypothetical protein
LVLHPPVLLCQDLQWAQPQAWIKTP